MSWADDIELDNAVGTPDAFKKTYRDAATRAGKALGVSPDVILGQWGLETDWGKKVVPGTNNLGNIKGPGVAAKDNQTGSTDTYRKYDSADQFADDYVRLIKSRYPGAVDSGDSADKFAKALKAGGYAQDQNYVPKVKAASAAVSGTAPAKGGDTSWADSINLTAPEAAQPTPEPRVPQVQEPTFAGEAARGIGLGTRSLVQGALSPVTSIGDLLNTGVNAGIRGVNALTGYKIPQLGSPSQTVQNALTTAGLPQPANAGERVASDIQSGAASALTGAFGSAGLAGAAANPVVKNALANLGSNVLAQSASGAAGGGAAGVTRELGGGPLAQFLAGLAGGALPVSLQGYLTSSDRATRNAGSLLRKALADNSPDEWNAARQLLTESERQKVPLIGPEAFKQPGIHELAQNVMTSPEAATTMRNALANRNTQVESAARTNVAGIGENVGTQAAADQAQEAAEQAVRNAQEYRTEAASPYYQGQRASDKEALDLKDQMDSLPGKILDLTSSANSATQVAGKLHAFVNDQINRMNQAIKKGQYKTETGETAVSDVRTRQAGRFGERVEEGKGGVYEAINRAKVFRAQIGASQRQLENAADQLAQKNLPAVQAKVSSFLGKLDNDIRVAGDTTEGRILRQYRDEIAPGGQPLVLPSQLESVYKANRDRVQLGLNPTAEEKTTAGVLKSHVKDLDNLIQDVSPAIKAGRQVYAQLSKEVVDPLLKSPVGRVAGRGADAQRESVASRALGELSGKNATPERISFLADQLGSVDKKAFPNLVRSYLEQKLNSSMKTQRSGSLPSAGVNFRDALEGTPQERTNLRTMIQKVAEQQGQDPTAAYQGFGRFLDVLDATGRLGAVKAPSRASETAAQAGRMAADAVLDLKSAGTKTVINFVRDAVRRKAYNKLAEVMTSPDAVNKMEELVKLPPKDPKRFQYAAAAIRAAQQATKPAYPDDEGD